MSTAKRPDSDRSIIEILPRHLVEKPWGRADLPSWLGQFGNRIGEVWYDLPEDPLQTLIKWIFTSEKLSIQVHPDDNQARKRGFQSGKEECWIVVDAEPGATLGIGTLVPLNDTELHEAARWGLLEALMDWKPVRPGDWYYIPAGTIHAIGAGVSLIEVQQNADITYRLYDYGRPRELHLEDGVAVASSKPYAGDHGSLSRSKGITPLTQGPNFMITHVSDDALWRPNKGNEFLVVPISGTARCGGRLVCQGDVLYGREAADVTSSEESAFLAIELGQG